jgi:hypothetical protein
MEKVPLPWEADRSAVEYPNIFESGTLAVSTWVDPLLTIWAIFPWRAFKSPITSR